MNISLLKFPDKTCPFVAISLNNTEISRKTKKHLLRRIRLTMNNSVLKNYKFDYMRTFETNVFDMRMCLTGKKKTQSSYIFKTIFFFAALLG